MTVTVQSEWEKSTMLKGIYARLPSPSSHQAI